MDKIKQTMEDFHDWHKMASRDIQNTMIALIDRIDTLQKNNVQLAQKLSDYERLNYQLAADKEKVQHMFDVVSENNKVLSEQTSRNESLAQYAVHFANANLVTATSQTGSSTQLDTSNNQTI